MCETKDTAKTNIFSKIDQAVERRSIYKIQLKARPLEKNVAHSFTFHMGSTSPSHASLRFVMRLKSRGLKLFKQNFGPFSSISSEAFFYFFVCILPLSLHTCVSLLMFFSVLSLSVPQGSYIMIMSVIIIDFLIDEGRIDY